MINKDTNNIIDRKKKENEKLVAWKQQMMKQDIKKRVWQKNN
jgi:hypothetical protein